MKHPFWLIPVVSGSLLLLTGCGRSPGHAAAPAPEPAAVRVQVQVAENKTQVVTEEVVGTVRAQRRATLEARVSGRIDQMPVLLGQAVKAGTLVARLDASEIKARLDQAEAGRQQAERDSKRIAALFNQQAATRAEYDAANSRSQLAQAAVAEAQALMSYVEVLAPFDGVVTKKWADLGDLALPGKPLVELEDPARLQLEADLPEAVAGRVQPEAKLSVRVDAQPGELLATVKEMAPAADPVSRTLRVKLDLPSADGLRSGQFARLRVPTGESRWLRVPAAAVVGRGQLEIVFVVVDQRARLRLVKTGRLIGGEVEVLAGLEAGESVVVQGAAALTDGQRVETR
jgi:RND family efflux transporter MFP subunit